MNEALWTALENRGLAAASKKLQELCRIRMSYEQHGSLAKWQAAINTLPAPEQGVLKLYKDRVAVGFKEKVDAQLLQETLMQLHPWRKGPFDFGPVHIDTEWRSDLKFNRIADCISWPGKWVLDVGCGNGYYGWRMLQRGASMVLGCDPTLLYVMQHRAIETYASAAQKSFVVPLADTNIPDDFAAFDVSVSMGVLYHRTSPIDHLRTLAGALQVGGQLLLETLIIDSDECKVLVPENRYAKMRNVWFIPSLEMLKLWLRRTGFTKIEVIDVSVTTSAEQRKTEWMTFESLADFLDPADSTKTIEGYPAPVRAIVTATLR